MEKKSIASLVSGGVDSSVSALLLKEKGFNPTIFYIKIWMENNFGFGECPWKEDLEYVKKVARILGLKYEVVSLQKEYWKQVVTYTINQVKVGNTPNPDMMCNKMIKFGAFDTKYGTDFDYIATGHYAQTEFLYNQQVLKTAKDTQKDQTYFLSQLSKQQLNKVKFPIGNLLKSEVRKIAKNFNLPNYAKPDSQGICFLGKINYREFIKKYIGEKEGNIVNISNGDILGKHSGFWFYTIGQRTGLGLAGGPWFVVNKNIEENTIFVAHGLDPKEKFCKTIYIKNFNWLSGWSLRDKTKIQFKIRHTPKFSMGILHKCKDDTFKIVSDEAISGVAKGQFGVIYIDNICIGGGEIY